MAGTPFDTEFLTIPQFLLKVNKSMKNSFIIKNIRRALLKQLIFPVLLLITAMAALIKIPRANFLSPRPLNSKSHYENFYNRALPYVTVSVPGLQYTGCNYVVNGRTEGYYYYTLTDGFCQFYLLDNRDVSSPGGEDLPSLTLKGRLIEMADSQYEAVLYEMAEGLDWTVPSLRKMTAPYAVSTLPYPVYLTVLFHLLAYCCLFLSLSDIICSLYYIWEPHRSPTFRYLGSFGEIRTLLPKVEIEMKHVSIAKSGNIYLTPGYIVNLDTVRSLILPLKSVVWVYYHSRRLALPGLSRFHFRMSYTLHIMADDGRTYDFTGKKKEDLDYIISSLEERGTGILLGYSEENRRLAREILKSIRGQKGRKTG